MADVVAPRSENPKLIMSGTKSCWWLIIFTSSFISESRAKISGPHVRAPVVAVVLAAPGRQLSDRDEATVVVVVGASWCTPKQQVYWCLGCCLTLAFTAESPFACAKCVSFSIIVFFAQGEFADRYPFSDLCVEISAQQDYVLLWYLVVYLL